MHIVKTALLSYGMSGKIFHAPFIVAHPGFQLVGCWERSQKKIQADYPEAISYPTMEALLADESIELVIINTPNNTHFDYATKALLANKNVVVEKAFTTTVAEGESLKELAAKQQKKISVYQNRRFDSDFIGVGTGHTILRWWTPLHRLICIERINVGSVGHRIGDFPIDRICLLREY